MKTFSAGKREVVIPHKPEWLEGWPAKLQPPSSEWKWERWAGGRKTAACRTICGWTWPGRSCLFLWGSSKETPWETDKPADEEHQPRAGHSWVWSPQLPPHPCVSPGRSFRVPTPASSSMKPDTTCLPWMLGGHWVKWWEGGKWLLLGC